MNNIQKGDTTKKGRFFIVSAPAGTGKTTLVNLLKEEFDHVVESISYTTRKPRPGELEGKDYFFVTEEIFQEMVKSGEFIETAEVFGHLYGTSRSFVHKEEAKGNHVILVIDTQGAMKLKGKIPAIYIFIMPPSLEELKRRLHHRNTEDGAMIDRRLQWAEKEMKMVPHYDYQFVNDDLDQAYQVLRSIIIAEEHRQGN